MPVLWTTNCHSKSRQVIMHTQIKICLTVEFKRVPHFICGEEPIFPESADERLHVRLLI